MGDIEKLTQEILKEAEQKAAQILAEAGQAANNRTQIGQHESLAHKVRILARAETEAKLASERIVSGARLKLRDEKLSAKGEVIDKVMAKVTEKIRNISEADTLSYILSSLKGRPLKADEKLIVKTGLAAKVKQTLTTAVVEEQEGISGFVIDRGGVIENYSFESTLDYLKEDLEAEASQILFPN